MPPHKRLLSSGNRVPSFKIVMSVRNHSFVTRDHHAEALGLFSVSFFRFNIENFAYLYNQKSGNVPRHRGK